ncbi:MAG: pseudouridine synthase [Burkholderiales bacterium]
MLPILFADDHLVAVEKPAGLLVHRSNLDRHETQFALQIVRDQTGREVFPVHRLDKPTSGVLVFAFDRETCRRLSQAFEAGSVEKRYLAVVRGHPDPDLVIDHPLARIADEPGARMPAAGEAQQAVTRVRRLAAVELPVCVDRYPTSRYALVELSPLTGRRHQLRRHLKHASHPIIGDTTYGKSRHNRLFEERFASRRLLLACTRLEFDHPVSGRRLRIEAPPSPDFRAVIAALDWPTSPTRHPDGPEPRPSDAAPSQG